MPNISFDIFFNEDIVNITASRSNGSAPKVKPGWKTRTAPKLPKKTEPKTAAFAKPAPKVTELSDSEPEEPKKEQKKITAPPKEKAPAPKSKELPKEESKPKEAKKIPKLPPKNQSKPKASGPA